ncbi:hypothetical protein CYY_004327 [Polysphondylium violaceum]|uniref:Phosphatidylethanolamine-binding protein PEBP n=1 Tax=Polysphondylium violaceum TaxID=133409 RepID=A0A8J4Q5J6_9MYCE|nr:hypothetical protein CYY_004327 [Polysphondylium violaceum]
MQSIIKTLKSYEIIPKIINSEPIQELIIKYGIRDITINDQLTPTSVQKQPTISFQEKEGSELYTLIFTDPDAPSKENPINAEWLHWLVTDIPSTADVSKGKEIASYIGAGPPNGTGFHRYIFVLAKQPNNKPLNMVGEKKLPFCPEGRNNWSAQKFIEKHQLTPVAINFFRAQYDESVPELYQQLGESKEKPTEIK